MAFTQLAGLEPADATKVLELVNMTSSPISEINAAFQDAFTPDRHGQVVVLLRCLLESSAGETLETVAQTVVIYHLIRQAQLASQSVRRSPVVQLAKASQFHELQRLEALLREDARAAESHKYKQQSAAQSGQGQKKQTAKEATEIDLGRCHLLLKAILFRQLLNRPDAESIAELLATPRAALESEADTWGSQPPVKQALIEAISDLKSAAESEAQASLGGVAARGASVKRNTAEAGQAETVTVKPAWMRPYPTTLLASAAELRFVGSATTGASVVLDAEKYSADWSTATKLLQVARSQPLTGAQHQQLVAACQSSAGHFNCTIQAFLDVSEHNPQAAAQILPFVPQHELYVDALIALPNATGCMRTEVLIGASGTLQPHQLSAYVKTMSAHVRGCAAKPQQQQLVSTFAVTLHQLCKKQTLSKADQDTVAQLFNEHASVSDVSSLWGSLLKS